LAQEFLSNRTLHVFRSWPAVDARLDLVLPLRKMLQGISTRILVSHCILVSVIDRNLAGVDELLSLADRALANGTEYTMLLQTQLRFDKPEPISRWREDQPYSLNATLPRNDRSTFKERKFTCIHQTLACSTPEEWNHLAYYFLFAICAVVYPYFSDGSGSTQNEVVRDGRWDTAKFVFMFCVLWSHTLGHWQITADYKGFPQEFVSRFHMPGFTLVSGIFAASGPVVELTDGGKVTISFHKLKSIMRDLMLVFFTVKPLLVAIAIFNLGINSSYVLEMLFHDVSIQWWYLGALAMWQLVTPMMCTFRHPVLVAGAVSLLYNAKVEQGIACYFVFFVAGFRLGGGGKDAETRKLARSNLEKWLCAKYSRVAAVCILCTWLLLACHRFGSVDSSPFMQAVMKIIDPNTDLSRETTPWAMGGPIVDAARMAVASVLLISLLAVVFWLPECQLFSAVGTRTLYVYLLHRDVLLENDKLKFFVLRNVPPRYLTVFCGFIAFLFTMLLGSKLAMTLTHHCIQPQWLIDLITLTPPTKSGSCSVEASIACTPQKSGSIAAVPEAKPNETEAERATVAGRGGAESLLISPDSKALQ